MKKMLCALLMAAMLSGCSVKDTFEGISDVFDAPVMAQIQQLELILPDVAAAQVMEDPEDGRIYFCDGYTVTVQTMEAGDLNKTLQSLTGYEKDRLAPMQTTINGIDRIECVWTAAGEGGDQLGHAVILDDGQYHYAVTAMADAALAGDLSSQWQKLFQSVHLVNTDQ